MMRTPLLALLIALLPLPALADEPDAPVRKTTELEAVRVEGHAAKSDAGAALAGFGSADPHAAPATIRTITREQLDDHHVRTLSELAHEDAALGDNYAPVGYYQNLSIRGYPLDLGTGYRLNNLIISGEQILALEDKQAVQVLKGLAGIDAGVIEPGGVVNFVSKRPAEVRAATIGVDSHGSRHVAIDAGTWLSESFGLRFNAASESLRSFVKDADGHRDFHALAADWQIAPGATLELDGNYQRSAQLSASGFQLLGGRVVPVEIDRSILLGHQAWQRPVGIHSANTSARLLIDLAQDWQLRLAAGRSRSVIDDNVAFAYGCYYTAACADGSHPGNYFSPDGDYDIYDYRSPDDTRSSDQIRATLAGSFRSGMIEHQIDVSLAAFHRSIERHRNVNEYVGSGNIFDAVVPQFPPSPEQPGVRVLRLDSWQRSLSLLDRMSLGEHWQLLIGAQHARIDERAWNKRAELERATRLTKTLPQAALLWQMQPSLTAYLSYGEGLSLGKQAPFWTSNDGDSLGPRHSRQLEGGIKWRTSDALDLNASLFRMRQPWQFAQPDASAAGFSFVERGEEVHSGIDVSADGHVTENLDVHASVAWIRARAQRSGTPSYEGHQLVNVPAWRSSVFLDYRFDALPQLTLFGGWRHAAANPATPDGRVRVDAYDVFDLGLRHTSQWREHDLTWRLGIDNLFNRFYWRDTGSSDGDSYLFPGAPRLVHASLSLEW
ncbi:MAG: TonB-dependent siderophore receptor [Dokdonella sp.]|uniref:TonB-dependent siderophore receptor n=1 Tax=Dokdonella sp. TaxID=2291710 RepID=UPI0025C4EFA4|nr:TonB-dependent siderophore receptor [Dokdonella sp.]MBZ0223403.1 TonB-dependent siderophore receptor [Dokdonella sp.]